MPKFYVHHVQGDTRILDKEGSDFPNLAAARLDVERAGLEILADHLKDGNDVTGWVLEIWDDQGEHIETVELHDLSTN